MVVPFFFFFFLLERVITAGFNSYCTLFISLFSQQEEFAYLIDQYASCSFCTSARLLPTATVSHSSKWQLSQPHTHTHTLTLPLALQHGHSFTETQWSVLGFKQWFFIAPDFKCTDLQWTKCAGLQFTTKFVQRSRSHIWTYVKLRAFVWDFSIRMFFIECHCVLSIFVCVGTKRPTLTALISPVSETMNLVFPSRLNSFSLLPGASLEYTMGSKSQTPLVKM